jgi:hypothetical protein
MEMTRNGRQGAAASAAATFAFADIAGFMALTEAHGDEEAADVQVADWTGAERRARITAQKLPAEFAVFDVRQLFEATSARVAALNDGGAGIGSFVIRITSLQGTPMVTYAADTFWRDSLLWANPVVMAFMDGPANVPSP